MCDKLVDCNKKEVIRFDPIVMEGGGAEGGGGLYDCTGYVTHVIK